MVRISFHARIAGKALENYGTIHGETLFCFFDNESGSSCGCGETVLNFKYERFNQSKPPQPVKLKDNYVIDVIRRKVLLPFAQTKGIKDGLSPAKRISLCSGQGFWIDRESANTKVLYDAKLLVSVHSPGVHAYRLPNDTKG